MSWSGEISSQAMKVFNNIIQERIAVKPGEHVLIVADTDTELELINAFIKAIKKAIPYSSRTKIVTRNDFLELNYKYLVLDKNNKSDNYQAKFIQKN